MCGMGREMVLKQQTPLIPVRAERIVLYGMGCGMGCEMVVMQQTPLPFIPVRAERWAQ